MRNTYTVVEISKLKSGNISILLLDRDIDLVALPGKGVLETADGLYKYDLCSAPKSAILHAPNHISPGSKVRLT